MNNRFWHLLFSTAVVTAATGGWFAWGPMKGPNHITGAGSVVEGQKVRLRRETLPAARSSDNRFTGAQGTSSALERSDSRAPAKSSEAAQAAPVPKGLDDSAMDSMRDAGSEAVPENRARG